MQRDSPYLAKLMMLYLFTFSTISFYLGPTMFLCCTWMAWVLLHNLKESICIEQKSAFLTFDSLASLQKWKVFYIRICYYCHEINQCLGFSMLVFVTIFVIRVITESFYIALRSQMTDTISYMDWIFLVDYLKEVCLFLLLLYVSTQIEHEVTY